MLVDTRDDDGNGRIGFWREAFAPSGRQSCDRHEGKGTDGMMRCVDTCVSPLAKKTHPSYIFTTFPCRITRFPSLTDSPPQATITRAPPAMVSSPTVVLPFVELALLWSPGK